MKRRGRKIARCATDAGANSGGPLRDHHFAPVHELACRNRRQPRHHHLPERQGDPDRQQRGDRPAFGVRAHARAADGHGLRGRRLAIASIIQITTFVDAARGREDRRWLRRASTCRRSPTTPRDLDVHDLAFDADGHLVFVNTLFSCLAAASDDAQLPAAVATALRLAARGRGPLPPQRAWPCATGAPAYVTAVAETDVADGWRDNRAGGGVVIDVAANDGRLPRPVDAALAAAA